MFMQNGEPHLSTTLLLLFVLKKEFNLGVKTCEIFLCFGVIVSLSYIVSILCFHYFMSLVTSFYVTGYSVLHRG